MGKSRGKQSFTGAWLTCARVLVRTTLYAPPSLFALLGEVYKDFVYGKRVYVLLYTCILYQRVCLWSLTRK